MKILTQSELLSVSLKEPGNKGPNPITEEIRRIAVGQSVLLTRDEWKLKTPPNLTSKGYKFGIRTLADNSGWVITRKV